MTYSKIREICKTGKTGLIPGWKGYIKYSYGLDQLQFVNGDYILSEDKLKELIQDRNDLFYII